MKLHSAPVMNGMVLISTPSQLSAGSHLVIELISKLIVVVELRKGRFAGSMPYLSGFCRVVGKCTRKTSTSSMSNVCNIP